MWKPEYQYFCDVMGIGTEAFTPYQTRLSRNGKIVDIYPTNRRYHDINKNKRGGYEDLYLLLENIFNL